MPVHNETNGIVENPFQSIISTIITGMPDIESKEKILPREKLSGKTSPPAPKFLSSTSTKLGARFLRGKKHAS